MAEGSSSSFHDEHDASVGRRACSLSALRVAKPHVASRGDCPALRANLSQRRGATPRSALADTLRAAVQKHNHAKIYLRSCFVIGVCGEVAYTYTF